ncbi:hypothetical protein [Pseudoalteromonas ruthenica]|nr:hypothetical protein [Pseudoalteromonas ruthenica]
MRHLIIHLALLSLTACQNNEPQNTTGEVETAVERASSESTADSLGKDKRIDGEQLSQPINEERAISATEQSIKADYQRLEALTQDKSCDSASQCKVVAVGSRACGGPSQYLVYSSKSADPQQVSALANSLAAQESQLNAEKGMMSICQHLTRPAAQCKLKQCVAVQSNVNQETY